MKEFVDGFLKHFEGILDRVTEEDKEFTKEKLAQYADLLVRVQMGEEGAERKLELVTLALNGIRLGVTSTVLKEVRTIVTNIIFNLLRVI